MARIKETFDSRAWFMLECDDPDCERRFDDGQWYAYEDDLLADVLQTVGNLITAFGITDEEVERAMDDCLERNRRKGRL